MNIDQLKSVVEINKLGSFSKAAESLFIPQPTLSNRIRQLEKELGVRLFIRGKSNTVRLTEAGQRFLPYAIRTLEILKRGTDILEELHQEYQTSIHFGCPAAFCSNVVPYLMSALNPQFPNFKFSFSQFLTEEIILSLKNGTIDVGITSYDIVDKELAFYQIYQEEIMAVVSPQHQFAKRQSLTLDEVALQPLMLFKPGAIYRDTLDAIFYQINMPYKVIAEVNDSEAIKRMVMNNLGITLLPSQFTKREQNKGELISIPIQTCPFSPYKTFLVYNIEMIKIHPALIPVIKELMNFFKIPIPVIA